MFEEDPGVLDPSLLLSSLTALSGSRSLREKAAVARALAWQLSTPKDDAIMEAEVTLK